jgi:acyl-CoA reductase-like NAD-dependent aldehyde dehydrogenase
MSVSTAQAHGKDPGFIRRPDRPGHIPPSPTQQIDAAVAALQEKKDAWVTLDIATRIAILVQMLDDLRVLGDQWVALSVHAKGVQGNQYAEAEEWAVFSIVLRNVRLLAESLREIGQGRAPRLAGPLAVRADGQVTAPVFPRTLYDRVMLPGTTAEVWMQPGVTIADVNERQAWFYRGGVTGGKVALVLGAGNASMLVTADVLYKLFAEGQVVILKMNPVNAYLGPLLQQGLRALIHRGYLRIVYGGADVGSYLCHHDGVDEIHMTGSDKTYEDIMFGAGPGGRKRKAERRPLLDKRFTGELGNVTPVIVVPGAWTAEEIAAEGETLARWLILNAGFNCLTPRVIVQWAGWEQRKALNRAIGTVLAQVPTRTAYYPGAAARHAEFLEAHPEAHLFGEPGAGHLPWTYIQDVDAGNGDDICFRNEVFCGLFAETAIEAESAEAFLDRAVAFANETLWGNLTATLVVQPASVEDERVNAAVERAITNLRYGMVLVNQVAALGYFAQTVTWGAFPGNNLCDIQSGIGVTANVLLFADPQKSVVRCPFQPSLDPFRLTSRAALQFTRKLVDLQYNPSLMMLPGLFWTALRS